MTNENTPAAAAVAPPAEPQAPAPPDFDALLADDTQADTPVRLGDLKPYLERRTGELAQQIQTDLRQRQERADTERRSQEQAQANNQADRTFARSIEQRLLSGSDEDRATAKAEMEANQDRYRRGLAVDWQAESSETRNRAIAEHVNPLFEQIKADGTFQSYLDALADPQQLAPFNGNWVLMALKHGEQTGYARGKAEAEAQADQNQRVNTAAGGPPALSTPANNDNNDLWEGIDRSKPGASDEYFKRLSARRTQGARR